MPTKADTKNPTEYPATGVEIGGRYILKDVLGTGGFARVYRGWDRLLNEDVAVKIVDARHQVVRAPGIWREAAVLRLLDLPGVVHFRDEGIDDGRYFLIMPLIKGHPFPGRGVRSWSMLEPRVHELLKVLSHVHGQGVVHGDLKAGNIFVTDQGRITLLDFGVAQSHGWWKRSGDGVVRGTPSYIAPELWTGSAPTTASDLFSLGVILYEVLTGQRLFPGRSAEEIRQRVLTKALPLMRFRDPDVPHRVRHLITSLLSKSPRNRPAGAQDALRLLVGESGSPTSYSWTVTENSVIDVESSRDFDLEQLEALFEGEDLLFHVPSRAAWELWRRTLGQPLRVAAELEGWIRHGIARQGEEGLIVEPATLERLYAGARISIHPDEAWPPLPEPGPRRDLLCWLFLASPINDPHRLSTLIGTPAEELEAAIDSLRKDGLTPPESLPDALVPPPTNLFSHWSSQALAEAHRKIASSMAAGNERRFFHLVRAGLPHQAAREALDAARILDAKGELDRAIGLLQEGWMAIREVAAEEERQASSPESTEVEAGTSTDQLEEELFITWTKIALSSAIPAQIERALVFLERNSHLTPVRVGLEKLLRAALLTSQTRGETAVEALDALEPFADEELELRRHMYGFRASWGCSQAAGEEKLADIEAWARSSTNDEVRGTVMGWQGITAYRQNRFEDSAELHIQAARLKTRATARMSSTLNAASSLIEIHRLDRAADLLEQCLQWAEEYHHPAYEGRARLSLRIIAHRAGEKIEPDPSLFRAICDLAIPELEGLAAITEAAITWRAGDKEEAGRLARIAKHTWSRTGNTWGSLLAHALCLRCEETVDWVAVARTLKEVASCPLPGVAAQIIGLLAHHLDDVPPATARQVEEIAREFSPAERASRREVLSIDEAFEALPAFDLSDDDTGRQ